MLANWSCANPELCVWEMGGGGGGAGDMDPMKIASLVSGYRFL